ncbi:hypothetical protein ONZ45_g17700 [Pleurotus djamor]|nr:hypothetical protein ONZ45_g17700 [Pleurotus djamor]
MPAYNSRGQARLERLQRLSPIATRAKVKVHEWLAQTSQLSSTFPSLATAESIDGLFPPLPELVGHTPTGSPALSYTSSPLSSPPASPEAGGGPVAPLPEPLPELASHTPSGSPVLSYMTSPLSSPPASLGMVDGFVAPSPELVGHTPTGSPALSYVSSLLSSPPASPGTVGGFVPPLPEFAGYTPSASVSYISSVLSSPTYSDFLSVDLSLSSSTTSSSSSASDGYTEITAVESHDFDEDVEMDAPTVDGEANFTNEELQAAIAEHPQFIEAQILVFRLRKAEDAYLASVKEYITALQVDLSGN